MVRGQATVWAIRGPGQAPIAGPLDVVFETRFLGHCIAGPAWNGSVQNSGFGAS